jgi:hypothetical protein
LGTSSNGKVCHSLIVAICTKLEMYCAMCIWSLREDQVFPVQSQRISQERNNTSSMLLVWVRLGGGMGSFSGAGEVAGGAGEGSDCWDAVLCSQKQSWGDPCR